MPDTKQTMACEDGVSVECNALQIHVQEYFEEWSNRNKAYGVIQTFWKYSSGLGLLELFLIYETTSIFHEK